MLRVWSNNVGSVLQLMRRDLLIGIAALFCLFTVIGVTELLFPYQEVQTEFADVESAFLIENADLFENRKVTIRVMISRIQSTTNTTYTFLETQEDLIVAYPTSFPNITVGSNLLIRGVSRIASEGFVEIIEVSPVNDYTSELLSIPGFLVFVILFFSIFTLKFRDVSFHRRS